MLKRLFFAGLLSTTIISGAQAADMEPPPTLFDWTGFYVGAHAGYGEASFDGIFDNSEIGEGLPDEATYVSKLTADGFIGGAQAGYNYQSGNLLLGVEADITLTDIRDEIADGAGDDVVEADLDFLASLRLRAGLVSDRLLVYGTGGLAYAGGEFTVIDDRGDIDENSADVDIDVFGAVVGGGLEWAVMDSISFRAEGLYYMFNDRQGTSDATNDSDTGDFLELDDVWVIRGGINYLLGAGASEAMAAAEPPPGAFDWTGFYVGGHAGYGKASFDGFFDIGEVGEGLPAETTYVDGLTPDGFIGGAQAGYNYQSGNLLLGVEADITFTDIGDEIADGAGDDVVEADLDFLASLRLRGGFVSDRLLVYGTGGLAYAGGEFTVIDDRGDIDENSADVDIDAFGAVVGGGLEWAAMDNISLRAEGLYYFFKEREDTSDATNDSDTGDFLELEDIWVIRGGINFLL